MLEFAGLSSSQEEEEEVPGALEDPSNGEQKASGVQCSQANHDEDSETIHETTATTEVKPSGGQAEKSEKVEIQEKAPSDGISEEDQVKKDSEEKSKQDEKRAQDNTVQEKETPQAKMKSELEEWSKSINDAIGAAGDRRG